MRRLKIITLLLVYSLFLLLLFSETLFSDFQEARRTLLVNHKDTTETLIIPKTVWSLISLKKEFNYKGVYYDTKSVTYQKDEVKVIVIKDKFEYIYKIFSKNLNSKNKKNHSKKSIDIFCIKITSFSLNVKKKLGTPYYDPNIYFKSNYLFSLFRPPSFI